MLSVPWPATTGARHLPPSVTLSPATKKGATESAHKPSNPGETPVRETEGTFFLPCGFVLNPQTHFSVSAGERLGRIVRVPLEDQEG